MEVDQCSLRPQLLTLGDISQLVGISNIFLVDPQMTTIFPVGEMSYVSRGFARVILCSELLIKSMASALTLLGKVGPFQWQTVWSIAAFRVH